MKLSNICLMADVGGDVRVSDMTKKGCYRRGSVVSPHRGERGLSSVIAIVLLVGVVAVGSVGILIAGSSVTKQSQEEAEVERVEQAFRQLDHKIASVAASRNGARTVDFDLPADSDGAVREEDSGRMVIYRQNLSAGTVDVLVNHSLGAIVYENDGTRFAYQAGAVWRGTGNHTRMVSAPPFSYSTTKRGREPTLTVPLTVATGAQRLSSGEVRIGKVETISPLNDVTVVEGDLITVVIKSEYYRGWAQYFNRTMGVHAVALDPENSTTVVEMVVPTRAPSVEGGVILGAAQESLKLKQKAVVDSYNSSKGNYSATRASRTRILASGDVSLKQDARIEGDLVLGGDGDFDQDARVQGNLSHSGSSNLNFHSSPGTHVTGWIAANASLGKRTSVDGVIDQNVAFALEENDNGESGNVSSKKLDNCANGKGCRLTNGTYLLDGIHLSSGETLILDTRKGSINLVLKGKFDIDNGTVRVIGDGRANVYLDSATGSEDFAMKQNASVVVPGKRAPGFWLYMDADAEAKLRQSASFTGVIYGPGRGDQPGTHITMSSTSDRIDVYGAVVGDIEPITQEVHVHYDGALASTDPIKTATAVPRLTFLHVSVNKVGLEDD